MTKEELSERLKIFYSRETHEETADVAHYLIPSLADELEKAWDEIDRLRPAPSSVNEDRIIEELNIAQAALKKISEIPNSSFAYHYQEFDMARTIAREALETERRGNHDKVRQTSHPGGRRLPKPPLDVPS